MTTTALQAHRVTMDSLMTFCNSRMFSRRRLNLPPLRRVSRLLDAYARDRIARACEGKAVIGYYGHPARRMLIACPQAGSNLAAVRAAVRDAMVVSGSVSCGNYVFSVANQPPI